MKRCKILLTNDDGITGKGLRPLLKELRKFSSAVAVVPQSEASASSHALSLHQALRLIEIERGVYAVNGTPADCVRLGIISLMRGRADLVVSGINQGPNLAEDVIYSGTVAGAREACMMGIAGLAVSLAHGSRFGEASILAARAVRKILAMKVPQGVFFNLNLTVPSKGIKITGLGKRIYGRDVTARKDPRGKTYYWIAGEKLGGEDIRGTDYSAVKRGYSSLTPLNYNHTEYGFMGKLNEHF